ncbi:hypothetical protein MN116_008433 [Schistosoma mekongi]|uniref:C2H2-type domain-containing protein n=1 Tax=Schistosoma mekongi TaxID=38744 RepID=A0AAE2D203_SCHME|nr:hypothetical protein MN116_008433 [Schistosoma mekongi]
MPRFKATPQQFNLDSKHESSNDGVDDIEGDMSSSNVDEHSDHQNDDSNGEHNDDSSQEDQDDPVIESNANHINLKRPPDTDESNLKRKLRKTNQNSAESVPVTTECLNTLQTAAFLAQAAAVATVAALSSGQLIPIFPSETPPIAPLGLSLPPLSNGNFTEAITTIVTTKTTEAPNTSMSTRNRTNLLSTNTNYTTKQQSPNVSISGLSSNNNDTAATDDDYGGIDEEGGEGNNADDEHFHQCKSREREKQFINCPVCCKTMRRGSLREHMDRHANSGKFKCDVCEKTFSRASAREKHLRTHTGERPYKCELCSKAYRQKVHLNEHLRSHTGVRPYLCKLCGFCLASKSLLNRHLRTHGIKKNLDNDTDVWMKIDAPKDEVLNIAAEVGRVLSQTENGNLNDKKDTTVNGDSSNNIQSPKNERLLNNSLATDFVLQLKPKGSVTFGRKYLCNICPAGFPTVQALRSHRMTTHNVVTPHKCPQCDDSFSSLKLMEGHLRKFHPQVCPICSKQMPERRRWMVDAHIREAHPDAVAEHIPGSSSQSKHHRKHRQKENSIDNTTATTTISTSTVTTSITNITPVRRANDCVSLELKKWKHFRPDKVHSSSDEDDDDDDEDEEDDAEEDEEERESNFDHKSFEDSNIDDIGNIDAPDEHTSAYSIDHEQLEENSLSEQVIDDDDGDEKTDFVIETLETSQLELSSMKVASKHSDSNNADTNTYTLNS